MKLTVLQGDCREKLGELPSGSVHCCVTSPPYFGLRDYGVDGQIGLESSPDEYVAKLVEVFREVKRVLRDDGTLWLNLGDSYARMQEGNVPQSKNPNCVPPVMTGRIKNAGLKAKDLIGIPWMVAFALRADGWYLRSDIIWSKPNPMPESVTDRPTKAHEYLFLLAKSDRYFYDGGAIQERFADERMGNPGEYRKTSAADRKVCNYRQDAGFLNNGGGWNANGKNAGRNRRSVWTVASAPYSEAHFATYPPALIKPCILAGCPTGGVVLDPFAGSGTTGKVALELGRSAVLIELNADYVKLIEKRCKVNLPLIFEEVA